MKKIAVLAALVMAATASFGAINIQWSNYGFLSGVDGKTYATEDATKILWELVYTAGDSITAPTLDEKTGAITYASGDEVLSSRLWEKGSDEITVTDNVKSYPASESPLKMDLDYATIASGDASYVNKDYTKASGGIYAAVFQYCSDGKVFMALTELNTGINWDNKMSAADKVNFNMSDDVKIATPLGTFTPVPEPATMSLLGLGALAMVIRRKLSK